MSNAHDYYGPGGDPELHNRGEGRRYIEPDYLAQEADDQLPMVSTLGCGPRGHGVYPHIVKSTDGEFYWQLVDDVTGEAVMDSPNLSAGKIEIVQPDRELLEGEEGSFDVRVVRGNAVQSYTVKTPAGSHGSRIYLLGGAVTRRADETYTCVEADLTVYGGRWSDCPSVRPGDIVVFSLKDSASRYLAFGTVQKASPAQVAFTSRTRIEWKLPYIGGNGNWFVEDQDTGVRAQGPQGPQGPAGEFGPLVAKTLPAGSRATARNLSSDPHVLNLEVGIPQGRKATFSAPTAHRLDQSQAPTVEDLDPDPSNAKLDFGIPDGKKAIVKVTPPVTLPAGSNATVGITENASDNSYTIQFGIPEGAAGKSIDIHPGVLKPYELPPFASTEVNAAFIVDDGDGWYDLYVRGIEAVPEVQWTIIENWNGEPGERWAVATSRMAIVEDFSVPGETISFWCFDMSSGQGGHEAFFSVFADDGSEGPKIPLYETDIVANPSGEAFSSIAIQEVYALGKVAAIRIEAFHPISDEMMGFRDIPVEHKLPRATTDSPGIVKLGEYMAKDASGALTIIPRQYCLRAVPPVVCKDGAFIGPIEVVCYYGDDEDVQKRADCVWTVEAYGSGGGVVEVSWQAQPASACHIDMTSVVGSDAIGIQVTATLIGAPQCSVSKTIPVLPIT